MNWNSGPYGSKPSVSSHASAFCVTEHFALLPLVDEKKEPHQTPSQALAHGVLRVGVLMAAYSQLAELPLDNSLKLSCQRVEFIWHTHSNTHTHSHALGIQIGTYVCTDLYLGHIYPCLCTQAHTHMHTHVVTQFCIHTLHTLTYPPSANSCAHTCT